MMRGKCGVLTRPSVNSWERLKVVKQAHGLPEECTRTDSSLYTTGKVRIFRED